MITMYKINTIIDHIVKAQNYHLLNNDYSLPSLFGGILLISYTLLQLVVGLKKNEDDEGEDI